MKPPSGKQVPEARVTDRVSRLQQMLHARGWTQKLDSRPAPVRWGGQGLEVLLAVWRYFVEDRCLMRSSALAYTTILSLVPFLALVFAILKGLGVQNQLEPLLLERFAVGGQEVISQIVGYINNTNVARLGTFGLALLVLTTYSLLSKIEHSFNSICGVGQNRSPFRRFADYFSMALIGPILLVAAISMTTALKSQSLVQLLLQNHIIGPVLLALMKLAPFVVMWIAFTVLYIFMPNTQVRLRAALCGGIVGGTLWQLAQYLYIGLQVGVAKYNAIYGSLAALPILLIWIHLSWAIVLLGLEFVYVLQNERARRVESDRRLSPAARETLALLLLARTASHFSRNAPPPSADQLAHELAMPVRSVGEMLRVLVEVNLLREALGADGVVTYVPATVPGQLPLSEVLRRLRGWGEPIELPTDRMEAQAVQRVLQALEACAQQTGGEITLEDLVEAEPVEERGQEVEPS